jgi:hypothetical protein
MVLLRGYVANPLVILNVVRNLIPGKVPMAFGESWLRLRITM